MATANGKRKRQDESIRPPPAKKPASRSAVVAAEASNLLSTGLDKATSTLAIGNGDFSTEPLHLQIVTGSYERLLHGLSASIPRAKLKPNSHIAPTNNPSNADSDLVTFSDTFLFAAHASAIRCLAISPSTGGDSEKRFLATGSSDERINIYSLSTSPPLPSSEKPNVPSLTGTATAENPRNRSLGSLIHHDRAITKLTFPTKSKLFSAAEDATIAISRTRDWTVLSSIKAPIPTPHGRPSGDTAAPGEIPAGVTDFAIHPSQKLMLSVGRGERCMRLWNLMTGKRAGVLNFERDLLAQVGEGKFGSGEGRRVLWDETGEHFLVAFEKGAALFDLESTPNAIIRPSPTSKVHQMKYLTLPSSGENVLALSTEDGRVLFFAVGAVAGKEEDRKLPLLPCTAQLGGRAAGVTGRVKDFEVISLVSSSSSADAAASWIVVTGNSDGAVRLWQVLEEELARGVESSASPKQIGRLIATQETGDRITCLGAFVLDGTIRHTELEIEAETAGAAVAEVSRSEDSDS